MRHRQRDLLRKYALLQGTVALVFGALTGCATLPSPDHVLYRQGQTVIRLEPDPAAGGSSAKEWNTHPAALTPSQISKVLGDALIQHERSLVGAVLKSPAPLEPVFNEEELGVLAPIFSQGLKRADPSERVAFTYLSPFPGRRSRPISGFLSVRDPYLIFALREHPGSEWQDPENPPPPSLFALDFRRSQYLKPGGDEERQGSYKARPTLQIDYKRYLAARDDQRGLASQAKEPAVIAPAVSAPAEVRSPSVPATAPARESMKSDAEKVRELQRQVKELNDANQELRAKLMEALDGKEPSPAVVDELTRLRQELAETKQLLADKVLELNRVQKKTDGAGAGKK